MRTLIALPELAKKYDIKTINVGYNPKHADANPEYINPETKIPYYTIPISLDLLIKNKVYLAYEDEHDAIITPDILIGVGNYWLKTLNDDHKNRRIDIQNYLVGKNNG